MHGAPWGQLACFYHFSCYIKSYSRADPEISVDAGEGDQAFVERVLEGTPSLLNHTHPFPEVCDLVDA